MLKYSQFDDGNGPAELRLRRPSMDAAAAFDTSTAPSPAVIPIVNPLTGTGQASPVQPYGPPGSQYAAKQGSNNLVDDGMRGGTALFQYAVKLAEKKASLPWPQLMSLSFLAGAHIGFAMMVAVQAGGAVPGIAATDPGVQRLLYAIIFPVGIISVLLSSAELVTSNMLLLTLAVLERRISLKQLLRNWSIAWAGNFAGSLFVAYLCAYLSHEVYIGPSAEFVRAAVVLKVETYEFGQLFLRGIGANWLVCVGVYQAFAARDVGGRIIALWFPIASFILIGFEHSVYNMSLIPLGLIINAQSTWIHFIFGNLLPVTFGNICGAVLLAFFLWHAHGQEPAPTLDCMRDNVLCRRHAPAATPPASASEAAVVSASTREAGSH